MAWLLTTTLRPPRPSAISLAPKPPLAAVCRFANSASVNRTSGPSIGGGGSFGASGRPDGQDAAVRGAEVRRHVAALLGLVDDLERADFLERRDEMLVDVLAHFGVVQGAHTERFGVVSGEARVFEVPGDVQHEDKLLRL